MCEALSKPSPDGQLSANSVQMNAGEGRSGGDGDSEEDCENVVAECKHEALPLSLDTSPLSKAINQR